MLSSALIARIVVDDRRYRNLSRNPGLFTIRGKGRPTPPLRASFRCRSARHIPSSTQFPYWMSGEPRCEELMGRTRRLLMFGSFSFFLQPIQESIVKNLSEDA